MLLLFILRFEFVILKALTNSRDKIYPICIRAYLFKLCIRSFLQIWRYTMSLLFLHFIPIS
jgi:hypothetical protein